MNMEATVSSSTIDLCSVIMTKCTSVHLVFFYDTILLSKNEKHIFGNLFKWYPYKMYKKFKKCINIGSWIITTNMKTLNNITFLKEKDIVDPSQ